MPLSILKECSKEEKHANNVSAILHLNDGKVLSADESQIKLWSSDLKLVKEVDSECGGVLSLAASLETFYSVTSDERVHEWSLNSLEKLKVIETMAHVPQKVFFERETQAVWVGDSLGRVIKYANDKIEGMYELTEEIWDLYVTENPTLVYTARDRDVLISEIVKGTHRSNAIAKATIEGRYPILPLSNLLCCLDRNGRNIKVFENSVTSKFKYVRDISVSSLILNAFCRGYGADNTIFAGGYDGEISHWDASTGINLGSVAVGSCINALAAADTGAYAALNDGRIVLVG